MKIKLLITVFTGLLGVMVMGFYPETRLPVKKIRFPYMQQGLTERAAAAHLLSRFTYGATPGQVDEVVKMGLENWFVHQLNADMPDDSLNKRLSVYDALNYTNREVTDKFPARGDLYRMAVADGVVSKDSLYVAKDKRSFNRTMQAYMAAKGLRNEQELYRQFFDQKILRATYSNNQLREVMTDFWFNHFNVSFAKNGPGRYIPSYERDVIRPNVFGKFDKLLLATAQSPAMLYYLDNANSVGVQPAKNAVIKPVDTSRKAMPLKRIVRKNISGLNENYAREVMELHTLGVDGGYTQTDVTQAAKVLTGWTVYSFNPNDGIRKQYAKLGEDKMRQLGYVRDSDFVFVPNRHDKGEKMVLGHHFDANGGYDEGVTLLEMLAHHPSAAKFISRKIAVRFVSDNPPASLIAKMSRAFTEHDGDIREVLIAMVSAPEFWGAQSLRQKTKSPFELAISSLRALNADIKQPAPIYNWVSRMGERLYYYLAPTGFPDRGVYWINTGSLLSRMNFGLALATHRIPGVNFNLAALNNKHEPESPEAALAIYGKLFMPGRDLTTTVKRLSPLLSQTDLALTVNNAANNTPVKTANMVGNTDKAMANEPGKVYAAVSQKQNSNAILNQVVGIIIGSPEFQRR